MAGSVVVRKGWGPCHIDKADANYIPLGPCVSTELKTENCTNLRAPLAIPQMDTSHAPWCLLKPR